MRTLLALILVLICSLKSFPALAGDFIEDQPSSGSSESGDSAFDPFSDYSEFEEGSEEEADVNFFHNGRFFTLGIFAGMESFTDVLGVIYKPDFAYGLFLSYFFDLRLSLQIGWVTASHAIQIIDARSAQTYTGKVGLSHFEFDVKYYLDTQNVTRGLGALNPYLLVGFSTYTRSAAYNGATSPVQDSGVLGFQGGAGIEFPFSKNSMFFGAQALYNYISFPDRGIPITVAGVSTGINPTGDAITILGLAGLNF